MRIRLTALAMFFAVCAYDARAMTLLLPPDTDFRTTCEPSVPEVTLKRDWSGWDGTRPAGMSDDSVYRHGTLHLYDSTQTERNPERAAQFFSLLVHGNTTLANKAKTQLGILLLL